MKKLLSLLFVCTLVCVLAACGGGNSPEGVATKAMTSLMENDYKAYVDLMQFKDDRKLSDEQRDELAGIVESKMSKKFSRHGDIKDFKIGTPKVEEDKAVVPVDLTFGDGTTGQETIKVVKNSKGDWKLDAGK